MISKKSIQVEDTIKYIFISATLVGFIISLYLSFTNLNNPEDVNLYLMFPFVFFLFPYIIYSVYNSYYVDIKMRNIPRFLRDIVDNMEGGMDFITAIHETAQTDYRALNYDVYKLSNRIYWGVDIYEALTLFTADVGSKKFQRDFSLIIQAQKIGGHVKIVIRELSDKIAEENSRNEMRKKDMSSNTVTGYISFGVFTLIVILLFSTLFSSLVFDNQDANSSIRELEESYNTNLSLFIILAYELAILSGFLFGIMSNNSFISGGPHVIILVFVVFILFFGFTNLGISPDVSMAGAVNGPSIG
ncbi:MAG: type II secretion system F family protein [Candidatus Nanoarchaeia archaeon]